MTPSERQKIRRSFGIKYTGVPVYVIPGSVQQPVLSGNKGGWYTSGGTPIVYPSAYSKKGWSNMVYKNSTRSISVGEEYLKGKQ